jgi:hypothetical protein
MENTNCPILQNRWKVEGTLLKYYGLRNYPYTLRRTIRLSNREVRYINEMDGKTAFSEINRRLGLPSIITGLINESVIVDVRDRRKTPDNPEEARFCVKCAANDYIIPGLEFDSKGVCAVCQAEEHITGDIKAPVAMLTGDDLVALKNRRRNRRFDIALMYTGGKDSSYLLYYLAKVLDLKVLACIWEIPFMSPNARENINQAKKRLANVELVERTVMPLQLTQMYEMNMKVLGNTCLCPSLAYIILYPLIASERIPYIVAGVEDVQYKNLVLNGFLSPDIYRLSKSRALRALIDASRVITLRKPYKKGQLETVVYLKQLMRDRNLLKKLAGYHNEMVSGLHQSFNSVRDVFGPLKETLRKGEWNGNLPALAGMDMDSISPGGVYDWVKIKETIERELGWRGTGCSDKSLHTSCMVEEGKDYSQYTRFRNMESMMIPFSALELSFAVIRGNISRDSALKELKAMKGFSNEPPEGYLIMKDWLNCGKGRSSR